MRNIHLLEQFMKENGIEYNVPFTVEIKEGIRVETKDLEICLLDDKDRYCELIEAHTDKPLANEEYVWFMLLFSDSIKIVKKPWKPKYNGKYWYVGLDEVHDGVVDYNYWEQRAVDFTRYIIGNCFKTEEEAEKRKDDVLKILNGEPLVKWEE